MGHLNTMLPLLSFVLLGIAQVKRSFALSPVLSYGHLITPYPEGMTRRLEKRFLLDHGTNPSPSNASLPSTSTLARCPKRCGKLSFDYPFGIGQACFRHVDFSLTCDMATQPPKLFLNNGSTEVLGDIGVDGLNIYFIHFNLIPITSTHVIPINSGGDVYNFSWKTPGDSFTIARQGMTFVVTSCDLDVYMVDQEKSTPILLGTIACPSKEIAEMVYRQDSEGPGWYTIDSLPVRTVQLQFVRHKTGNTQKYFNLTMLWDRINITVKANLAWNIVDQTRCLNNMEDDRKNHACISNHSSCVSSQYIDVGYACRCNDGYVGNPYIMDGCKLDDEGCAAREVFQLSCVDNANSVLQYNDFIRVVSNIFGKGPNLYVDPTESASVQWAVANLTCQQAQQNTSTYACVSTNSSCSRVISTMQGYVGYRCTCLPGYDGNPYIPDGCKDIDECLQTPRICKELCHNTEGNYSCTMCPDHTEYDVIRMQCTPRRNQSLLLAIIRRWKRDVHKKIRRKYFQKNQGLLLEQLISSDENASEKTKIFSIEELKRATNNFDSTRILGRGGHGTIYKGILSNQHVVAIKKAKVIKEGEINDFINEVAILSQINHRNIVKLFGCCLETEVPLLVYDFIPNGSLFELLHHDSSSTFPLSWGDRLRIAAEAAGALCYLHSAASISIFHRDVKSSNILLDANYTAKVSDFGASRSVPVDQSHVVTNVQGTFGYLDPEYYQTGQLNEKSDVYSFGMVLLELLLRMQPIFTTMSGMKQNLCTYFLSEIKTRPIIDLVDPPVLEEANEEDIRQVASLAEMCIKLKGEERPTMRQVEITLQLLRTERMIPPHVSPDRNQEIESLLTQGAIDQVMHALVNVDRANVTSQRSQTSCYSLEKEFLSSASLPR
uniref:Protein kinase domain-containing protein n=1 Tax=Oryza glumipatula TaxID=40148 RepID=A0A0E0B8F8_9ORYZ